MEVIKTISCSHSINIKNNHLYPKNVLLVYMDCFLVYTKDGVLKIAADSFGHQIPKTNPYN